MLLRTLKAAYDTLNQPPEKAQSGSTSHAIIENFDAEDPPPLNPSMPGQYQFGAEGSGPEVANWEEILDGMETDTESLIEQFQGTQLGSEDDDQTEYVSSEVSGGADISATSQGFGQGNSQGPTRATPPDIHTIAHSSEHQKAFDENGVSWAIQWEIARYITSYPDFTWKHVPVDVIPHLCGSSGDKAPSLADKLLKGNTLFFNYHRRELLARQPALTSPWEELDREETLIRDNTRGALIDGHGGRVQQRVRLDITKSRGTLNLRFTLDQPTKSKSCRFSRFLGSRRLIECHFSKQDARNYKEAIVDFFVKKKLLLNGRLFQAFFSQEAKVVLMEINQDFDRDPSSDLGDNNRMSLLDFINWHNNLHLNDNQLINKWVSRFALGFSTSQPGLVFQPKNIHLMDDLYVEGKTKSTADPHQIMTDGCGFMNYAALKAIEEKMAWGRFPTCIQARIAGAKGLFMLHPDHRGQSEEPQIWLRSSQIKVKLNHKKEEWSPVHYILDVVSGPLFPESSSITYEIIMSLSENGIPDEVLVEMLRDTIAQEAQSLEPSSKPHGSQILYDSVYTTQRVLQSRLRMVVSPEAHRAQALFDPDEEESDEAVSAKWDAGPDPFSGQPASSQEQVLGWLQAGFSPTDKFVMEKLVYLQKKMMEALVKKYRIAVPGSTRAFIVPDPLGVLEEDQVFFASSQPIQTSSSGLTYCITGPVLVSRNPCIQVSDTRKVLAVDNYELWSRGYFDVIVFSTKGNRSLASLLSGGDYDGDTVVMIWDEVLTNHFTNSPTKYADPGPDFERNFEKSKVYLRDVKAQAELNKQDITPTLIAALLQNISPNPFGVYNIFYRNSVYLNGLRHPTTVRLGHMFTQCLDAIKSGLVVREDVRKEDKQAWNKEPPSCFPSKSEYDGSKGHRPPLGRRKISKGFILDILQDVAAEETKKYKIKLGQMRDNCAASYRVDRDLTQPLAQAETRLKHPQLQQFQHELQTIKDHVKVFRAHFADACGRRGKYSTQARRGNRSRNQDTFGEGQESIRAVSEDYSSEMPRGLIIFSDAEVRRIAASYAYKEDIRGKLTFCFAVAWAELCAIKAQASGGAFATLTPGFIDSMAIHRKMAKVFREMEGDEVHDG